METDGRAVLAALRPQIVTTPTRWFLRGVGTGVLLSAAVNALSYFFRSDRFGDLLGLDPGRREALGFPLKLWESGNTYGGFFVDYPALLIDAAFAAIVGGFVGAYMLVERARLNRLVEKFENDIAAARGGAFQFSLQALLLAMGLAALAAAGWRLALARRPEVLGAIYALGPWLLVMIAYLPARIPWKQRVAILVPTTLALIAAAMAVGAALKPPLEFDKVLMGIFVCWTPQSALAALAVTLVILLRHGRKAHQV